MQWSEDKLGWYHTCIFFDAMAKLKVVAFMRSWLLSNGRILVRQYTLFHLSSPVEKLFLTERIQRLRLCRSWVCFQASPFWLELQCTVHHTSLRLLISEECMAVLITGLISSEHIHLLKFQRKCKTWLPLLARVRNVIYKSVSRRNRFFFFFSRFQPWIESEGSALSHETTHVGLFRNRTPT